VALPVPSSRGWRDNLTLGHEEHLGDVVAGYDAGVDVSQIS
jgi:hypothetical protein